MKVSKTFTFIVSRNYGHPLTWNVDAWRVYVAATLAVVLLAAMVVFSAAFLIHYPRLQELERHVQDLEEEREVLLDRLHSARQEAFRDKVAQWHEDPESPAGSEDEPYYAGTAIAEDLQYVPPLRIGAFDARVYRSRVEASFRLVRQGDPQRQHGGFLFAVFENRDAEPSRYVASPKVEVNERGFPQYYKAGIRFSRIRHAQTYRRRVYLDGNDEYYTHVTVYLFSLRGGLLVRERYRLERDLFFAGA